MDYFRASGQKNVFRRSSSPPSFVTYFLTEGKERKEASERSSEPKTPRQERKCAMKGFCSTYLALRSQIWSAISSAISGPRYVGRNLIAPSWERKFVSLTPYFFFAFLSNLDASFPPNSFDCSCLRAELTDETIMGAKCSSPEFPTRVFRRFVGSHSVVVIVVPSYFVPRKK